MLPVNSRMWVSPKARECWDSIFKQLSRAILQSMILGVHEGRWQTRSFIVSGNDWFRFLSTVKAYNVAYSYRKKTVSNTKLSYEIDLNNREKQPQDSHNILPIGKDIYQIVNDIKIDQGDNSILSFDSTLLSIVFWEAMGLSLFTELTDGFTNKTQITLVESHIQWMKETGFANEANHLLEILSWPVEWSTSHGIDEIKTPIAKMCGFARTVIPECTVRINGTSYPEEGAIGVNFPYNYHTGRKKVTDSRSYQSGLRNNLLSVTNL